jgi:FecR-like protein
MTCSVHIMWPPTVWSRPWVVRSLPDGVVSGSASILCFLAVLFFLTSNIGVHAAVGPEVGTVTKVENPAQVGAETAIVGTLVHMNDELRTGPKGRLQVTFRDGTTLTLGENAKVVIDRYVYNPDTSTGQLALNAGVGAFRLATGKLSDMRKKNIDVSTPVAALAIRGTDVWWGPIDGQFGVLLVAKHNANVDVSNEDGSVTLDNSGKGTDIDPLKGGGAPGRPYEWPPEKIARALAQTSFGLALNPATLTPAAAAAAALAAFAASTAQGASP